MRAFPVDAQYTLNYCTKYLARYNPEARHAFTPADQGTVAGTICEAWRFPMIDTYAGGSGDITDPALFSSYNQVTFVFRELATKPATSVGVIGTFNNLYSVIPMSRVPFGDVPTAFWAISVAVPKRQVHRYRYVVDGKVMNDEINPQTTSLPTGQVWSRFFTEECAENLVLEDWEQALLYRLVEQMAPFRTTDGQRFLDQFYTFLDNSNKISNYEHAYRFDESVGEVGYIDNLLAREEHHRLVDYKICLSIIRQVLRLRNPFEEPVAISGEYYNALYDEMATDKVDGWDTSRYGSPLFFLNLLRRHACAGSFSHPKYGGNSGGAGWAYLSERFPDGRGGTLFDWGAAIEPPLGRNAHYLG